jgi:hypothetical protein
MTSSYRVRSAIIERRPQRTPRLAKVRTAKLAVVLGEAVPPFRYVAFISGLNGPTCPSSSPCLARTPTRS